MVARKRRESGVTHAKPARGAAKVAPRGEPSGELVRVGGSSLPVLRYATPGDRPSPSDVAAGTLLFLSDPQEEPPNPPKLQVNPGTGGEWLDVLVTARP
jgi:hypothetical protein